MNRVLAENLYKSLKQVKQTKISSLPVLNHAKLEFLNGELIITSTDLENPLQARCSAIVNDEWSTCVPNVHKIETGHDANGYTNGKNGIYKYYPFLEFVKVCAEYDDVLELDYDSNICILKLKVQGERSFTEFKCMDVLEFPNC